MIRRKSIDVLSLGEFLHLAERKVITLIPLSTSYPISVSQVSLQALIEIRSVLEISLVALIALLLQYLEVWFQLELIVLLN